MHWALWLQLLIRSTVILAAGELLRRWHAKHSAALRYRILLASFALLALLPLFSLLLPEVPFFYGLTEIARSSVSIEQTWHPASPAIAYPATNWAAFLWLGGVALALLPAMLGIFSFRRLFRGATPLLESEWQQLLKEALPRTSRSRPRLAMSGRTSVPLTGGIFRACIILPPSASHWSRERRRAVLLHELAHVRRHDVAWQIAVHLVTALWWFQPLAWILRNTLRAESEFAADAAAMQFGLRPSAYAAELLAIAQGVDRTRRRLPLAGVSMLRGDLENRLRAILAVPRSSLSKTRLVTTFLVLVLVSVGAATVTAQSRQSFDYPGGYSMKRSLLSGLLTAAGLSAATISGSLYGPNGASIPDAKLLLYSPDNDVRQEGVTTADGAFALDVATAGQYILRVEKPGFSPLFREFNLKEDSKIARGLVMQVDPASRNSNAAGAAAAATESPGEPANPIRVGGMIAQNNLIRKKQPVYPEAAKAAKVQGAVELECVISKEGVPVEIRVLSSPDSDLTEAALEAVGQWRYRPTLLNGNPVAITTDVKINFTLSA